MSLRNLPFCSVFLTNSSFVAKYEVLKAEWSRLTLFHLLQWNHVRCTHLTQVTQLQPESIELGKIRLFLVPPSLFVEKGEDILERNAVVSVHVHHLEPEPIASALHTILRDSEIRKPHCTRC